MNNENIDKQKWDELVNKNESFAKNLEDKQEDIINIYI